MIRNRFKNILGDIPANSPESSQDKTAIIENLSTSEFNSADSTDKPESEDAIIDQICQQLGVDFADLSTMQFDAKLADALPKSIAVKYHMVPIHSDADTVSLVMSNPLDFAAQEEARTATKKHIIPMIASKDAIDRAITKLYGEQGARDALHAMEQEAAEHKRTTSTDTAATEIDDAPTVRLINTIFERAVSEKASDIHIEPNKNNIVVRIRVDGVMHKILDIPKDLQAGIIARLKILGGMKVTERRHSQDGRAELTVIDKEVDFRFSTLPTVYGESVVIRILDKENQILSPLALGMNEKDYLEYKKLIESSNGVILTAGPTGSGKTSTMYSMIHALNSEEVKLITLEDPVEYDVDGVNQVQIDEKNGVTFANGLRSALRQDPDIIAIGEIRDGETAEIAMRAAITGHLVLSTIHTYDVLATVDRLTDVGVEPYLIASGLKGIISQRLVRRICPHCREEYQPTLEELEALQITETTPEMRFYHGKGCPRCMHTGYRGRIGIFEILTINQDIRRAIADGASRSELQTLINKAGFEPMKKKLMGLLSNGVTSPSEAIKMINSQE